MSSLTLSFIKNLNILYTFLNLQSPQIHPSMALFQNTTHKKSPKTGLLFDTIQFPAKIKKPILWKERMGDCRLRYNLGNPATIFKTSSFAPYPFKQLAFVDYILLSLNDYPRSSFLPAMSRYVKSIFIIVWLSDRF